MTQSNGSLHTVTCEWTYQCDILSDIINTSFIGWKLVKSYFFSIFWWVIKLCTYCTFKYYIRCFNIKKKPPQLFFQKCFIERSYNVLTWRLHQVILSTVEDSYSSVTLCVCICVLPLCSQLLRGQCWSVAVQTFQSHWHAASTMMMSLTLLLGTLGLLVQGETLFWKLCFRMQPGSPQWCSAVMEKHWNKQHLPSSIYSPC